MDERESSHDDLMNALKYGHAWYAEKIKGELSKLITMGVNALSHDFRYDSEDKYHYIYDNECTLFIFDGKIDLRSDRDNVSSTDKTFTYDIKNASDIQLAYQHFNSLILEDE